MCCQIHFHSNSDHVVEYSAVFTDLSNVKNFMRITITSNWYFTAAISCLVI